MKIFHTIQLQSLTYEGCRELGYLHPHHGLDAVSDATGQTQEVLVAAELRAGDDHRAGAAAMEEVITCSLPEQRSFEILNTNRDLYRM